MRKILFRGQDKNAHKWYEGSYWVTDETTYCYTEDYERHLDNTHHYILFDRMTDWGLPNAQLTVEVIPETVGQYTGILDIHKKRIFEGDIVKVPSFNPAIMAVAFREGAFCLVDGAGQYAADIHYVQPAGEIEAEVIGNIFDNRDLLLACPNTRETLEELKKQLGLAEQEPETPSYG